MRAKTIPSPSQSTVKVLTDRVGMAQATENPVWEALFELIQVFSQINIDT